MKNVFKMLGALAIASSLMGCIIIFGGTPTTATQTTSSGIDAKTVKIFYKVTDAVGAQYSVNANGVTEAALDSALLAGNQVTSPRAIVPVGNTVTTCPSSGSGEGCFQIVIADPQGKAGVSGKISFKLDGAPLTLNYSATFLKPASAAVTTTEGVDSLNFKIYFTAKTASNQVYNVNKAGLTEITIANVNQTSASGVSPRAVIVVPVTAAVTCDALNAGQGCFQITLGSRSTNASITIDGTVNFKLDGVVLNLPFTHVFPAIP
jgi:hypothetical protein